MSLEAFVGRQPILDRDRRVVAYELLFRSSRTALVADFSEKDLAALRVIANTFATLGEEAVLGGHLGFFNVTRAVLLADEIFALPRERVVVELLEEIEPDREVAERCRTLREVGYRIALDDWVPDDPRRSLLPWANVVKVDLPAVPRRELGRVARSLRGDDRLLLAEKVETQAEFDACHGAGFDRFQGYFFARPTVLEGAGIDPAQTTLVRLMQQISTGSDNAEIVESLKQDAKLGVNLIRIVNTAGHAARVRLESIEDGVRHLGLRQLSRWVSVLLYAQGQGGGADSPLLTAAAHRGRLMEQVATVAAAKGRIPVDCERAFLVGMLSLVDALLGRPIEDVVRELRLGPDIALALIAREGELGRLLLLAEATEQGAFEGVEQALDRLGLTLAELQQLEHEAWAWLHALQKSLLG